MLDSPAILEMRDISKRYPGVVALGGVNLEISAGEVHALLGENGAGKSTLMKVLGGATQPDSGEIVFGGRPVRFQHPLEARLAGIAVVYQEFNLVPGLSAAENIFLGRERSQFGIVQHREQQAAAAALFERLGATINPKSLCQTLTVAEQQLVEIARALAFDVKVLVLDEPTAALTDREVECLFKVVRELRKDGIAVIYISHRLDEIFALADCVTVLRDGQRVDSRDIKDLDRAQLIELMVGRPMTDEFPQRTERHGNAALPDSNEPLLTVENLNRGDRVHDVSFSVKRGEILAFAGLVGAGRTETARLIFGADRKDSGTIKLNGQPVEIRSPRDAIRAGIGLLTEDRKAEGLILSHAIRENFGLPNLGTFSKAGWINQRAEADAFAQHSERLKIKAAGPRQAAGTLSGGNQQKVVLAKWLARQCDVLIFDEPTRGIDVGAKYEIYLLIHELAAAGKAMILISSELPEVLGMADRILVMHEGRITGEIESASTATQADIMQLAVA